MRPFKPITVLALLAFVLTGCFLPARFDAEIEISRNGFYKMEFEGFIVEVLMYRELRDKKLDADAERKKADNFLANIRRSKATKEASYFRQGAFKVKWARSGDLLRTPMVNFYRRGEDMLSIRYRKDTGEISVSGKSISKTNRARVSELGIGMEGELRVKTDARVLTHNATSVATAGGVTTYTWKIETIFAPTPRMTLRLR